jgi:hypothetical protein
MFNGVAFAGDGSRASLRVTLQERTASGRWETIAVVRSGSSGRWQATIAWGHYQSAAYVSFRTVVEGTRSPVLTVHIF